MYLLRVILDIENSSSKNWINKNVMIYQSKETILCDFSNTFWLTVCPNHVFYSTIKHPIKSNNLTNLCKVLILRNFFSTNIWNTPKSDGQDKILWSRQSPIVCAKVRCQWKTSASDITSWRQHVLAIVPLKVSTLKKKEAGDLETQNRTVLEYYGVRKSILIKGIAFVPLELLKKNLCWRKNQILTFPLTQIYMYFWRDIEGRHIRKKIYLGDFKRNVFKVTGCKI